MNMAGPVPAFVYSPKTNQQSIFFIISGTIFYHVLFKSN